MRTTFVSSFAVPIILLISLRLPGQGVTVHLGAQRNCIVDRKGETGNSNYEASYPVEHELRNDLPVPLKIRIGSDPYEFYEMFRSDTTARSSDIAYQYNPDSFGSVPASSTRTVEPHQSFRWMTQLAFRVGGAVGLRKTGAYVVRLYPDVQIFRPKGTQLSFPESLMPLYVTSPATLPPVCSAQIKGVRVAG